MNNFDLYLSLVQRDGYYPSAYTRENSPLQFGQVSYQKFSEEIFSNNENSPIPLVQDIEKKWLTRKITAIPLAIYGLISTIYHLAKGILFLPKVFFDQGETLKLHGACVIRDLQETFGRIASIFHDTYGLYHIQEARFHKYLYFLEQDSSPTQAPTNQPSVGLTQINTNPATPVSPNNALGAASTAPVQSPSNLKMKSGFPNFSLSCWLSMSLQLANVTPEFYAQNVNELRKKEEESEESFEKRKKGAELILNLLEKSRIGLKIELKEIETLRNALHEISFPYRHNDFRIKTTGMDFPMLKEISYILDGKEPKTTKFIDENGEIPTCFVMQFDHDDRHPLGALGEKTVTRENGIPVFPFTFIEEEKEAPLKITTATNGFECAIDSENDLDCLVRCSNGTYCYYELVAISILRNEGVPHYFAYVKESDQQQTSWVEYNDSRASVVDISELFKNIPQAHNFIYRKRL